MKPNFNFATVHRKFFAANFANEREFFSSIRENSCNTALARGASVRG
jgi:hypothetical protein